MPRYCTYRAADGASKQSDTTIGPDRDQPVLRSRIAKLHSPTSLHAHLQYKDITTQGYRPKDDDPSPVPCRPGVTVVLACVVEDDTAAVNDDNDDDDDDDGKGAEVGVPIPALSSARKAIADTVPLWLLAMSSTFRCCSSRRSSVFCSISRCRSLLLADSRSTMSSRDSLLWLWLWLWLCCCCC